jgi:RNA polymerase sporulation-specific sigma factor
MSLDPAEVERILRVYRPLVMGIAQNYFIRGADREDVVQEGMIGLWKAIRDFRPELEIPFENFVRLCVRRQIITAVKTATRAKQLILSDSVSLETPLSEEEGTLVDLIPDTCSADLAEVMAHREFLEKLFDRHHKVLSPLEQQVLRLYVLGYSYQEIARYLGCKPKTVDCALYRIKKKARRLIQEM